MKRYLLHMNYIGTHFKGMQKQKTDITVQGTVEAALKYCLRPPTLSEPLLFPSSRTDTGVHALSTTAHVDLIHPSNDTVYDMRQIVQFMNRIFQRNGHKVRITSYLEVSQDFHARHSAISRSYLYRFTIPKKEGIYSPPAIELNRCYVSSFMPFDAERVKKGVQLFVGLKDFRTFAQKAKNKYLNNEINYVRQLQYFTLEKGQPLMSEDPLSAQFDYWNFRCGAKSFLYNQVRRMVGALIALGIGKITEKDIRCMLEVPSHQNWDSRVSVVPSEGLYLCGVDYDPLDLKRNTICDK